VGLAAPAVAGEDQRQPPDPVPSVTALRPTTILN